MASSPATLKLNLMMSLRKVKTREKFLSCPEAMALLLGLFGPLEACLLADLAALYVSCSHLVNNGNMSYSNPDSSRPWLVKSSSAASWR